jgi:hypothetical protein
MNAGAGGLVCRYAYGDEMGNEYLHQRSKSIDTAFFIDSLLLYKRRSTCPFSHRLS